MPGTIGSARILAGLGAEAIGTTSAGFAFTLGLTDGARVDRDTMLAHCQDLVAATPLPVSGDLENGYAEAPDGVAETVRLAAEAGLAGCSIEDIALPGVGAYPMDLAVERIRAAAAAARALPRDFVLLARADGLLTGAYALPEAMARVKAFEQAGADGVYIPGLPSVEALAQLCAEVSVPVNALASGALGGVSRSGLAKAGAARISIGAALARATHKTMITAAKQMLGTGDFSGLGGIDGDEVDALLAWGSPREALGILETGDLARGEPRQFSAQFP